MKKLNRRQYAERCMIVASALSGRFVLDCSEDLRVRITLLPGCPIFESDWLVPCEENSLTFFISDVF